jgi:hypothetical protein
MNKLINYAILIASVVLFAFSANAEYLYTKNSIRSENSSYGTSKDLGLNRIIEKDMSVKKDLMISIYKAQASLSKRLDAEKKFDAINHINMALYQLDPITIAGATNIFYSENPEDAMLFEGRKAIEFNFGDNIKPENAVLPIEENVISNFSLDKIIAAGKIKSGTIEGARIRYVSYLLPKDDIRKKLDDIKKQIRQGQFLKANYDLLTLQYKLLESPRAKSVSARVQVRDNISLARYLNAKGEFAGALSSIDAATDALRYIKDDENSNVSADEATLIKAELEQAAQVILTGNTSILEEVDRIFKKWINELS